MRPLSVPTTLLPPHATADRIGPCAGIPSSIEYFRAGKLRAPAVTTATRSDALPDIPTLSDFLPSYEASFWATFVRLEHARGHSRQTQQRDKCWPRRSQAAAQRLH